MRYKITIQPNQGYGPDQTRSITVRDLMEMIADLDQDAEICTYDYQNTYGAKWGGLTLEIDEVQEEEEQ